MRNRWHAWISILVTSRPEGAKFCLAHFKRRERWQSQCHPKIATKERERENYIETNLYIDNSLSSAPSETKVNVTLGVTLANRITTTAPSTLGISRMNTANSAVTKPWIVSQVSRGGSTPAERMALSRRTGGNLLQTLSSGTNGR